MLRRLVLGMNPGIGGVQTYLINLYKNIVDYGIQMDFVISGNHCYYSDEIKKLGGQIFYICPKKKNVITNIIDLFKVFFKCRKTHKIVYFNFSVLYYNIPFILAKMFRYPIIISHAHSTKSPTMKKGIRYFLHCLNRIDVTHRSDYLLACSKLAAEWVFGKKALEKGKVKIVRNAIYIEKYVYDEDIRNNIREKLGISKDHFVIGHIGRLSYEKNQLYLIDIFKEIYEINNNAILLLVGDGKQRSKIESIISKYQLKDNVLLLGARSDVYELLQAMDVFVLPSYNEGLGIVLIEAQTSGLYCFASKYVIPDEVNITGLVNFIELNKSPKYWADQIMKYSRGYQRKSMDKEVKKAGYDIIDMSKKFREFIFSISKVQI